MKRPLFISVIVAVFVFAAASSLAAPAGPMMLGNYGAWKVYSFPDKGVKVCFMSIQPQKQEGKFKKRDDVFFFVTHWSNDKDKNVVSVSGGYIFKTDSLVTITLNGKKFSLFTQGSMAWTKDHVEDEALLAELQHAASMVITGTSSRGTLTTDTYATKGGVPALQVLSQECQK